MLVYLNTCEQGGETTLFVVPGGDGARCDAEGGGLLPDDARRLRWPPEWRADAAEVVEGSVLVFSQDLPHEGAPVGEGHRKVIIRTDVMYRREPPVCADPQGLEAYALWQQAQARSSEHRARCLAAEGAPHCSALSPAVPFTAGCCEREGLAGGE